MNFCSKSDFQYLGFLAKTFPRYMYLDDFGKFLLIFV